MFSTVEQQKAERPKPMPTPKVSPVKPAQQPKVPLVLIMEITRKSISISLHFFVDLHVFHDCLRCVKTLSDAHTSNQRTTKGLRKEYGWSTKANTTDPKRIRDRRSLLWKVSVCCEKRYWWSGSPSDTCILFFVSILSWILTRRELELEMVWFFKCFQSQWTSKKADGEQD